MATFLRNKARVQEVLKVEAGMQVGPVPTPDSPIRATRAVSWKRFAGRTDGSESYHFGDLATGLFGAIAAKITTGRSRSYKANLPATHATSGPATDAGPDEVITAFGLVPEDEVKRLAKVRQLRHRCWPLLPPLSARYRVACSSRRPCSSGADWSLSSDGTHPDLWRQVGEGASSTVYKALWRGKLIASKMLQIMDIEESRARMMTEIEILSTVEHPHIVAFVGAFCSDEQLCIFSEFAEHGSLYDQLHSDASISGDVMRRWSLEIGGAIAFIHDFGTHGIVHRDIKSPNVLLFSLDGELVTKICDFGVAHLSDISQSVDVEPDGGTVPVPSILSPMPNNQRAHAHTPTSSRPVLLLAMCGVTTVALCRPSASFAAVCYGRVHRPPFAHSPCLSAPLRPPVHLSLLLSSVSLYPSPSLPPSLPSSLSLCVCFLSLSLSPPAPIHVSDSRWNARLGTIRWMAPEAITHAPLEFSTPVDVYGFGMLLYELNTR